MMQDIGTNLEKKHFEAQAGGMVNQNIARMDDSEWNEWTCRMENAKRVEQTDGIECGVCGNKGRVWRVDDETGSIVVGNCECLRRRQSLRRLDKSSICRDWRDKTFGNFDTEEPWQATMKDRVLAYIADSGKQWLYVCGQSGSGKTHLCTAAYVELVKTGYAGEYVRWADLMQKMNALRFKAEEYDKLMKLCTDTPLLYLDDFFKRRGGKVSDSDIDNTLALIDARYTDPRLLTIFSSELTLNEIARIDEALGGRIMERTKGHAPTIMRADGRNHRTKK